MSGALLAEPAFCFSAPDLHHKAPGRLPWSKEPQGLACLRPDPAICIVFVGNAALRSGTQHFNTQIGKYYMLCEANTLFTRTRVA